MVGILGIGKLSIGPVPRHHQLYIGAIIMLTITTIIVSFSPSVSTPSFIRLFWNYTEEEEEEEEGVRIDIMLDNDDLGDGYWH